MDNIYETLFKFPILDQGHLKIQQKSESEWKFLESVCRQLINKNYYFESGYQLQQQIKANQAIQFVFKEPHLLNKLTLIAIKIRKDVIYNTYKITEADNKGSVINNNQNSMFNLYLELQNYLVDGYFNLKMQQQFERFKSSQYGMMDFLMFSHLNKNRSFHRIIVKLKSEQLAPLNKWYLEFKQFYQIEHFIDPDYLPRKEKKIKIERSINKQKNPSLVTAVEENNLEVFSALIAGGASMYSIAVYDRMQVPIPHLVCDNARIKFAEFLTENGVDWECQDSDQMTPIFYAIKSKSIQMIEFLKKQNVNLEHPDIQDRTPFYYACSKGHMNIVKLLQSYGVNVNAPTKLGRTPFSKSSFLGLFEVIEYLVTCPGININAADKQGRDALHNASFGPKGGRQGKKIGTWAKDSPIIVQFLLEKGMNVESMDKDLNTPLHVSASSEALESIPLLIAFGADVNRKNKWGETPLIIATKFGHVETVRFLYEIYNASLTEQTNDGLIPLEIAARASQQEVYEYLIQKYINIFQKQDIFAYLIRLMQITQDYQDNIYVKLFIQTFQTKIKSRQQYLQILQKMKDQQLELLKYLYVQDEITQEDISYYFIICLKNKNISLLKHMIDLCKTPYILKLNDESVEHLLQQEDADINYILLNLKVDWMNYISNKNETILHKLIQLRKTAVIVNLLNYLQIQMKETSKQKIHDYLIVQNEYQNTVIELTIIHQYMDIYAILQDFMQINFGTQEGIKFRIVQSNFTFINKQRIHEKPLNQELIQEKFSKFDDLQKIIPISQNELKQFKNLLKNKRYHLTRPYILVDTVDKLDLCVAQLSQNSVIGVDIECHSETKDEQKFIYMCTLQLSVIQMDYLIDVIELRPYMNKLKSIFLQPEYLKLFHGCETDIKVLFCDLHFSVNRIFDTGRVDMKIKQGTQVKSLKQLSLEYLGKDMDKTHQKSDWRIRPFQKQMIEYACADASTLLELFPILFEKARKMDMVQRVFNSCQKLTQKLIEKNQYPILEVQYN